MGPVPFFTTQENDVLATARKLITVAARHRRARAVVQIVVSLLLLVILFRAVGWKSLAQAWHAVGWQTLALGSGLYLLAIVLCVRRWQIFLRGQGIDEGIVRLFEVFMIGLFCGLFLPTSVGGDAYRIYDVSRRRRSTMQVALATLQDRLLGLGGMMLVGLVAAFYYWDRLPKSVSVAVLGLYSCGLAGLVTLLYHGAVLRTIAGFLARWRKQALLTRCLESQLAGRLRQRLLPLRESAPLDPWRMIRVLGLSLGTFLTSVAMYEAIGSGIGVHCGVWPLCLIVSMVAVARMLPSQGGIGVGEDAFVMLAGLFGVSADQAGPVALLVLGIGTSINLVGGLLLLRRMLFPGLLARRQAEPVPPVLLALSPPLPQGGQREAA
jgi:uncharacterized protein (TIRG00374 family)